MLNPVAMSIVTNTFTEPRERSRAIGLWGSVLGLSIALGPVIGGALVDSTGWRGVFWVNVPVGIAGFILAARFIPESRAAVRRRLDPVGQVLIVALLGALSTAIIEGPDHGWSSPLIIGLFAAAVAALGGLLAWEPRRNQPLIDLRFFRSLPFSGAALSAIAGMAAFSGFLFLMTLYLQEVRGYEPLVAGLFLLPMALIMAVSAPLCGLVMPRWGTRVPLLVAGTGITAAGVALSFVTATSSAWYVLLCCLIMGIGLGWLNAPITNSAVSGMPRAQAGTAAGIASTSRQVGNSLGVAVGGSVLAANLHGSFAVGFTAATRPAWYIVAALGGCVAVMALVATGRSGRASAQRAAELIELAEAPAPAPAPARAA
jgi:EmrB/QacA subfamily drug resistance transporter